MISFINAQIIGQIHKDVKITKSAKTGREYARFCLRALNPRTSASQTITYTFVECTIWDSGLIKSFVTLDPKPNNTLMVDGQIFLENFNGKSYVKCLCRNVYMLEDKLKEREVITSAENDLQAYNGATQTYVSDQDYEENF